MKPIKYIITDEMIEDNKFFLEECERQLADAELLRSSTGPGAFFISDEDKEKLKKIGAVKFKIGEWKVAE